MSQIGLAIVSHVGAVVSLFGLTVSRFGFPTFPTPPFVKSITYADGEPIWSNSEEFWSAR